MCRNIRNLYNFRPPAAEEELRASSLWCVRRLSGFEVFNRAVDAVARVARELVDSLVTTSLPSDREVEA
jgi:hypothetical protein